MQYSDTFLEAQREQPQQVATATASLAQLHDKYRDGIPCPNDFNFATHVVDKWAKHQPPLLALHWVSADFERERKLTYAQLAELSERAAVGFAQMGIRKGDRVLIQLPRVCEWWICLFGLMRLGAVAVPGTTLLVSSDLSYRAESCKAVAFIGDRDALAQFDPIAAKTAVRHVIQVRVDNDGGAQKGKVDFQSMISSVEEGTRHKQPDQQRSTDLAVLFFTSGTTGKAKMVLLEQEWTLGHSMSGEWYGLSPGQLFLNMADLGWAKAAYSTFGAFNFGATLFVQTPPPGPFQPNTVIDLLHRYPIQTLCCPPTIFRALLGTAPLAYLKAHPPLALEDCTGAGEPLNPSCITQWRETTGILIREAYGQTETSICVANFKGEPVREGSMGKMSPWYVVGVIGNDGRELGLDEEGELAIRADVGGGRSWIMKGYVRADGSIDKAQKTHGGKTWYCTGDRAKRDKDGYFWFVGRDDDVITSSGYRIGPFEVESALKEHPAVQESAAVASPDKARGEIVKAFIQLHPEYHAKLKSRQDHAKLAAEIQAAFKSSASAYKYPREIEFVTDLPRTASGKIRRVELRNAEYEKKAHIVEEIKAKL